jgi:uncharacterized membrane protein
MFKSIFGSFGVLVAVILIIALAIIMPFLTIWSVNTLFPALAIPYTLETWSAVIILGIFFGNSYISTKKKD